MAEKQIKLTSNDGTTLLYEPKADDTILSVRKFIADHFKCKPEQVKLSTKMIPNLLDASLVDAAGKEIIYTIEKPKCKICWPCFIGTLALAAGIVTLLILKHKK